MKKTALIFLIFSIVFLTSCDMIFTTTSSATMTQSYDFVNEEADVDYNNADIIIEPWVDNPALQLAASWGDSSNMLLDMGEVSISTAEDMDLSEGTTGYDEWDAWPIEINHVYTFLNREGDRVYMLINDIDMSTYTDDYTTEISFDYDIIEE